MGKHEKRKYAYLWPAPHTNTWLTSKGKRQWNPEGNSIASILFIPFTTCPHELHEKTTMG